MSDENERFHQGLKDQVAEYQRAERQRWHDANPRKPVTMTGWNWVGAILILAVIIGIPMLGAWALMGWLGIR